jgi:putative flippase GtrA
MATHTEPGLRRQFARFASVGVLGFIVDAMVLYACIKGLGLGLYAGRLVSYLCAATTTWYLNRRMTFAHCDQTAPAKQWLRFLATNGVGGLVNFGSYSIVVATLPAGMLVPLLGVAVGSIAGLFFNFTASRLFVFKAHLANTRGTETVHRQS